MDTIPSSTSGDFSQMAPPDGFVTVIGSPKKDAPIIQITGAEPVCGSGGDQPPLSPPECGVALCDWDDFHHHYDDGASTGDAEHPTDCESHHAGQRHHDPCDSRGRPRRSDWAGLGKCPSPSRNSPRRHSPIPYSPKRQHHHHHHHHQDHHRNSTVGLNDVKDVVPGPRRHSHDVAFLSRENAQRPCSLPLTSFPSDEFICVSYSDAFSSPTITHASDALLAISINCSQEDMEDDDMGATSSLGGAGQGAMASVDVATRGSDGGCEGFKEDAPWSDSSTTSKCPSAGAASLLAENGSVSVIGEKRDSSDSKSLLSKGPGHWGQDETRFEVSSSQGSYAREFTKPASEGFQSEMVCGSENSPSEKGSLVAAGAEFSSSNRGHSAGGSSSVERIDSAVESMEEEEEGFHEAFSSDSSSDDDDMEEMLLASQPCSGNTVSSFTCRGPCMNEQGADSGKYGSFPPVGFVDSMRRKSDGACPFSTCNEGLRPHEHAGPSSGGHLNDATSFLSVFTNGSAAWRRASFPGQPTDLPPLTSCSPRSWEGGEEGEDEEARRRRRSSSGSCVSRTPEDYALPRVVGFPPLHFPHGRGAVLVHCALPSPYDPDLPTPPIVLTPHTSYMDLNNAECFDTGVLVGSGGGTTFSACHQHGAGGGGGGGGGEFRCWDGYGGGNGGGGGGGAKTGLDISRSRSFPNLDQKHNNNNNNRFQEPDQIWPRLGDLGGGGGGGGSSGSGECGYNSMDDDRSSNQTRNGCQQQQQQQQHYQQQQFDDRHGPCNVDKVMTCRSLPGSPSHSNGRAAVIGRLRSVVERRLSAGTVDTFPDGAVRVDTESGAAISSSSWSTDS